MKTLDQVITTLERCTDYEAECEGCPYKDENEGGLECVMKNLDDVLHYLKEYRDAYGNVIASMNHHLRKIHELEQNDPLTWDELQQMARKPVWIEWKNPRRIPRWWIVDLNEKPDPKDYLLAISTSGTKLEFLYKREQGDVWQAYRKERE